MRQSSSTSYPLKTRLSPWMLQWGKCGLFFHEPSDCYFVASYADAPARHFDVQEVTGEERHENEALRRGVSTAAPLLTGNFYRVESEVQSTAREKEKMSTKILLRAFASALVAAAKALEADAGASENTPAAAKPPEAPASVLAPKRGRPPKTTVPAALPAPDDLGGDDLGGSGSLGDDLGGSGSLGDDLGGLGESAGLDAELDFAPEPEAPKGPTEEDVRTALRSLQAKDGNTKRVVELMARAIGDKTKQPSIPNVPPSKYQALLDAVKKLIAK